MAFFIGSPRETPACLAPATNDGASADGREPQTTTDTEVDRVVLLTSPGASASCLEPQPTTDIVAVKMVLPMSLGASAACLEPRPFAGIVAVSLTAGASAVSLEPQPTTATIAGASAVGLEPQPTADIVAVSLEPPTIGGASAMCADTDYILHPPFFCDGDTFRWPHVFGSLPEKIVVRNARALGFLAHECYNFDELSGACSALAASQEQFENYLRLFAGWAPVARVLPR